MNVNPFGCFVFEEGREAETTELQIQKLQAALICLLCWNPDWESWWVQHFHSTAFREFLFFCSFLVPHRFAFLGHTKGSSCLHSELIWDFI